ncbi:MAG: sulfotransferase family 2 domain-containing protein [Caldilineaceae bacterium]|nr:sulfotransferase family 2 domain-containing protein [Caldilineaceae bacterium]
MISHKHKFIFIHIPKTAGTSIEQVLRDPTCQLLPGEWDTAHIPHAPLNHLTLQELADYACLTPTQLKSYFKFCFVWNPWDRLVSEIFCRWMSPWFADRTPEQRIRHACALATAPTGIANHLRPQCDFIKANGLAMDFIGRFEYLATDFAYLCHLLGIPATLPHLNRSAHHAYQGYYTADTQALVAATYECDLAAFLYQFEPTPNDQGLARKAQEEVDAHLARPLCSRPR